MSSYIRSGATGLALLALFGCDGDGVGLTGSDFEVRLAPTPGALAASALGALGDEAANVELDQVTAITVVFNAVEILPAGGDENGNSWILLEGDDQEVDLASLPPEGISLADVELMAGDFRAVRLLTTGTSTIEFNEEVTVGQTVYPADEPIDLEIPSGEQSGLKVFMDFSVEVTEVVTILFDESTSVQNLTATGADRVLLNPVLTAQSS